MEIYPPQQPEKQKKQKKVKKVGFFGENRGWRMAGGGCPGTIYSTPVLFKREINSSYSSQGQSPPQACREKEKKPPAFDLFLLLTH